MAKARIFIILAALMFTVPPSFMGLGQVQTAGGGDQFLDGIGETALVARYLFNGNAEDRSRNNLHAALRGDGLAFVQDPRFGQNVLQLSGQGGYVQLPGQALSGEDAMSITGWLFQSSEAPGQKLFDFGPAGAGGIGAWTTGAGPAAGFRAYVASGPGAAVETNAVPVPVNRWVHLAVVLDPASRTLTGYLNGAPAVRAANVEASATQLFGKAPGDANRLYIGRGLSDSEPTLQARLRDFRIYRIALTEPQVAAIRNNALAGLPGGAAPAGLPLPPPAIEPMLHTAVPLESVPDIKTETIVGHLPRLPKTIPAVYQGQAKGPDVRVVWPAPKDNAQVLEPGTYTVTGKVPGSSFQPKAVVTVKAAAKIPPGSDPPDRALSARPSRPGPGHPGAGHAVHQEPRQVPPRPGGHRSKPLPL